MHVLMSAETGIILGLLTPLAVALLTPFLAVRAAWRDAAGPVGAVVTFIAALHVAAAVLEGGVPKVNVLNISDSLDFSFAVTPLGAIFGLVASGLWIA
ncbi:MAG: monovalent cation/H+ antiporter subunit D family protein, partial [Alphaproteobacteria bacterium]